MLFWRCHYSTASYIQSSLSCSRVTFEISYVVGLRAMLVEPKQSYLEIIGCRYDLRLACVNPKGWIRSWIVHVRQGMHQDIRISSRLNRNKLVVHT
ncbi:hypothetical protein ABKN59_001528 [Abortiporus biennis]